MIDGKENHENQDFRAEWTAFAKAINAHKETVEAAQQSNDKVFKNPQTETERKAALEKFGILNNQLLTLTNLQIELSRVTQFDAQTKIVFEVSDRLLKGPRTPAEIFAQSLNQLEGFPAALEAVAKGANVVIQRKAT